MPGPAAWRGRDAPSTRPAAGRSEWRCGHPSCPIAATGRQAPGPRDWCRIDQAAIGGIDPGPQFVGRIDAAIDAVALVGHQRQRVVAGLDDAGRHGELHPLGTAGGKAGRADVLAIDLDRHARGFGRHGDGGLHRQHQRHGSGSLGRRHEERNGPAGKFAAEEQIGLVGADRLDLCADLVGCRGLAGLHRRAGDGKGLASLAGAVPASA